MRVIVTGHRGQLGNALLARLQSNHEVQGLDLPEHDITNRHAVQALVTEASPDVVINSAAMTDVDGCARNPELAYRVNGMGTQNLALAARASGAEFMQISTNEVFEGTAQSPYYEWADRHPINAYGISKLAGEWYAERLLQRFYIVRTAWLYAVGGRNFPHRIIQLADERGALSVVDDEVSSPTFVPDLVEAIVQLLQTHAYGIYHLVNEGTVSRYELARALIHHSGRGSVPIEPITSAAFQRASTPPPYTPLANNAAAALGIRLRPWEEAVAAFVEEAGYRKP